MSCPEGHAMFDLVKSGKLIIRNASVEKLTCSQFGWTLENGTQKLPVCKKGNFSFNLNTPFNY